MSITHCTESDLALSRGFAAGNYAAAYVSEDFETARDREEMDDAHAPHEAAYWAGFLLGFYSTHELDEMGGDADDYLEALNGPWGKRAASIGIAVPDEQDFDDHNQGNAAF